MKIFYLIGAAFFTVMILILSFENIGSQCSNLNFFFYTIDQNPTIIFLGTAVIGIITGAFYHAFLVRVLSTPESEEDQDF